MWMKYKYNKNIIIIIVYKLVSIQNNQQDVSKAKMLRMGYLL